MRLLNDSYSFKNVLLTKWFSTRKKYSVEPGVGDDDWSWILPAVVLKYPKCGSECGLTGSIGE